jgi:hypothetical protein
MGTLTVAYVTARKEPKIEWFSDSLYRQDSDFAVNGGRFIMVDTFADELGRKIGIQVPIGSTWVEPKPNVWQGKHRLTKEDWWAKSNALNTAICLCETDWIAFVDDRSVLMPGWLDRIHDAMQGRYAVCGSYEKHINMKVENGVIVDEGTIDSLDQRQQLDYPQPTKDWYGGHGALPLSWCLAVNGFSEDFCDGLGLEDCMFGLTLYNAGFPICYDSRMRIIEDRTQGEIDGALRRTDKGVSPDDKSHAIVAKFQGATTSMNSFELGEVRDRVLHGQPFPPPSASPNDFFDGQPISEFW